MVRLYRRLAPGVARRCELWLGESSAAVEVCQGAFGALARTGRPLRSAQQERSWLLARARMDCFERLRLHRQGAAATRPRVPRLTVCDSARSDLAQSRRQRLAGRRPEAHPGAVELEPFRPGAPSAAESSLGQHLRACPRCRRLLRLIQAKRASFLAAAPLPTPLGQSPAPARVRMGSALGEAQALALAGDRLPESSRSDLTRLWLGARRALYAAAETLAVDAQSGCIWFELDRGAGWTIAADPDDLRALLEGAWVRGVYASGERAPELHVLVASRLPAVEQALRAIEARLEALEWCPIVTHVAGPERDRLRGRDCSQFEQPGRSRSSFLSGRGNPSVFSGSRRRQRGCDGSK